MDEKDKIKEIQIFIIQLISSNFIVLKETKIIKEDYYQILNFFRDFDFCLKILLLSFISTINNIKIKFFDEFIFALSVSDIRYVLFTFYSKQFIDSKKFNEKEKDIINDTLKIKDFIVIGNNNFHEKIKTIEKDIQSKSFEYLDIKDIENYLYKKKKDNNATIQTYFYFLIIRYKEYKENFEYIFLLSFKTGISFLAFIYIEETDKFYKDNISFLIPTILVYSAEDIIIYLSQKFNFFNPFNLPNAENIEEFLKIKIPKITFKQNEEDKYQNGCFELAETFDINLIRNNFMISLFDDIDYISEFTKHIYNIYKEHNALDLFYSQNCLYLGWKLYPELIPLNNNICFVKRFLYIYCREEKESKKSLYNIINEDLRSREPRKIYQLINILALINDFIEKNYFANYKGVVYRATKLDEKLILKLVPGTKMVNTSFWSTSKDFEVAERYMKGYNYRNAYIICKTTKNNIDIDLEKVNTFDEKEVLFVPFTEFIVEKISSEEKFKKKIYIIKLKQLENKNFVNSDNMQIENINYINMPHNLDDFLEDQIQKLKGELLKYIKFE